MPDPQSDARVEAALDAYWLARANGTPLDVDAFARDRRDEHGSFGERERALFRGRARAQEYRGRLAAGERCSIESFLADLAGPSASPAAGDAGATARAAFLEELRDAAAAERVLPGELPPGTVLDAQYEILDELGRGGMGIVYAAWDLKLAREVAIKVLHRGAASTGRENREDWERLALAESKSLAGVESRNIVTIHDVRTKGAQSYIVMDRVRGVGLEEALEDLRESERMGASARDRSRTLRRLLSDTTRPGNERTRHGGESFASLPPSAVPDTTSIRISARMRVEDDLIDDSSWPRTVASIVRAVVLAVETAHARGVLHRDLKPKNVILLPGGSPVVLDFGLAARRGADPLDDERLQGTPQYLAPEQARARRTGADVRIDVYQLGLVLYEMLTLRTAVERLPGEPVGDFLERVAGGLDAASRARLSGLPRSLIAICARATTTSPEARYPSAAAMRADLDRFLAGLPNRTARTRLAHEWSLRTRWLARKPVAIASAALLVAVASAGLLGVAFSVSASKPPAWSQVQLAPWLLHDGATAPVMLETAHAIDFRSEKDCLGVTVSVKQPTWIYAFSVFGDGEDLASRKISPAIPEIRGRSPNAEAPDFEPLQVMPGENALVSCAWLEHPAPYEGLLVLAVDEPSDWIADLQRRMEQIETTENRSMGYQEAQVELRKIAGTPKGRSAKNIPPEVRVSVFRNVASETPVHRTTIDTLHMLRCDLFLQVQNAQDRNAKGDK